MLILDAIFLVEQHETFTVDLLMSLSSGDSFGKHLSVSLKNAAVKLDFTWRLNGGLYHSTFCFLVFLCLPVVLYIWKFIFS